MRPVDSLAALAAASLRDLAKAMPDHPAARLVLVHAVLIEAAAEANDEDYLADLLGVDADDA
jgi:hypothetical protein